MVKGPNPILFHSLAHHQPVASHPTTRIGSISFTRPHDPGEPWYACQQRACRIALRRRKLLGIALLRDLFESEAVSTGANPQTPVQDQLAV